MFIMKNKMICNWPLQLGFKVAITTLQLNDVFLWHECYQTSCTKCNKYNSLYVELYMYETHAIQLHLCKNNYYVIPMQLVYNYCHDIMLTLFSIHPSSNEEFS